MKKYIRPQSNKGMEYVPPIDKPTVFISYNWGNSDFANIIETELSGVAEVHRDTKDIKVWGSITEFMKTIRTQDFAVLIISEAYLKSDACLYEVVQLMKDDDWNSKSMYVVMHDAHIYDAVERARYVKYWNEKCDELEEVVSTLSLATCAASVEDLKKAKIISLNIGDFFK